MGFGVFLNQCNAVILATGKFEVVQRDRVNREEAAGRTIFRSHVGNGGAVRQGECGQAGAKKFDEFSDHGFFAQHLGDQQHEVRGGDAFHEFTSEFEADDFRQQHGLGLTQHGGFGFDAANTPAEDAKTVDHRRVRVSADKRVGIGDGDRLALEFFVACPYGL